MKKAVALTALGAASTIGTGLWLQNKGVLPRVNVDLKITRVHNGRHEEGYPVFEENGGGNSEGDGN